LLTNRDCSISQPDVTAKVQGRVVRDSTVLATGEGENREMDKEIREKEEIIPEHIYTFPKMCKQRYQLKNPMAVVMNDVKSSSFDVVLPTPPVEGNKIANKVQHTLSTDVRGGESNSPRKQRRKICEAFDDDLQHSSPTGIRGRGSTSLPQAVLLFFKNIKRIQRNHLLKSQEFHFDQLEHHIDLLMSKLIETTKAGWSKIYPLLLKGLNIGWNHLWLKSIAIASVFKKELELQLEDGEAFELSEKARETWKKQHAILKKHGGNLIHRSGKVLLDTVGKYAKGRKDK